jgi:hypothetical protein
MKKLSKIAVSGLLVSGLLAFAQPSMVMAAPKANPKSPTNQGATPRGKPFVALNSRIDALQLQIDTLIGQFSSLEDWQKNAEEALAKLQQDTKTNADAIAVLQGQIATVEGILATKQDIISGTCPDGQTLYEIPAELSALVCRTDLGTNGLAVFTVQETQDIAAASDAVVTAACPADSAPAGGSYAAAPGLEISSAGIEANGYSVVVANPTDAPLTLNVTATCLGAAASP